MNSGPKIGGRPKYRELPTPDGSIERHAWEYYGRDDELGALGEITPDHVVHAIKDVRTGRVFNLNLPIDQPGSLTRVRPPHSHIIDRTRTGLDDHVDGFNLQQSTHWDGLRHIKYRHWGYFGGRTEAELLASRILGIDAVAAKGIVTRGVLADVFGFSTSRGLALQPDQRSKITVALLQEVLDAEGVDPAAGDVLLVRTGWLNWYLGLDEAAKASVPVIEEMSSVGLDASQEMAEWLWNRGFVGVAADNTGVEVFPVDRQEGFLHYRLLPLLGIYMGELWALDELAADCQADGVYKGLFFSAPLNVPGGVGTPANAYLIK